MKIKTYGQSLSTWPGFQPGELVFIALDPESLPLEANRKLSAWPVLDGNQNINDWLKSVVYLEPGTPVLFLGVEMPKSTIGDAKARILYGERVYTVPLDRIQTRISITYGPGCSNIK